MSKYERKLILHTFIRHPREGYQETPPKELGEAKSGDRCPRPGCGGLVLDREVVTDDGSCWEVYCSSCSRTGSYIFREPYQPLTTSREPGVDRLIASLDDDTGRSTSPEVGLEEMPLVIELADLRLL